MSRRASVVLLLLVWIPVVNGDFPCLCCYSLETTVYRAKALTAGTLGFMYEFDCKPLYENVTTDNSWTAIQYEHKIGYVQLTQDQVIQQCPGSIPTGDQVTETPSTATSPTQSISSQPLSTPPPSTPPPTKQPPTTQPPSTQPSSTQPPSTQPPSTQPPTTQPPTTQPPTTQPPSTQPSSTQPPSTQPSTTQSPSTQPSTTQSPSTQPPTTQSPSTQPSTTQSPSTQPPTTQPPTTQSPITQLTTGIQPITTQPPQLTTTQSTTTTTSLKTIQTTKPTALPTLTTTYTKSPSTTIHHANTLMPSMTNAPANSCPYNVVTHASHNQGYVMSHGDSCFELVLHTSAWNFAEHSCQQRGGHLTSIKNQAEENALLVFMYDHGVKHEVWIGLTDQHQEHHFTWSSGLPLEWTNWIPGNQNPFFFNDEDCVALVPDVSLASAANSNSLGTWDDVPCNLQRPFICRFDANPSWHLIG